MNRSFEHKPKHKRQTDEPASKLDSLDHDGTRRVQISMFDQQTNEVVPSFRHAVSKSPPRADKFIQVSKQVIKLPETKSQL